MANERDNAFTSTGIGGMGQGADFDTASTGASGTDRAINDGTGQGAPMTARAKEAVSAAGHKAADRVQERIADQVSRATGQLESVASSLRTAGAQMPDNGIGRYMVQAATQVDNLASFLNNREVGELVDEVEEFARRQPAVFIGGAFALGVLGARFLRSSRQNMGIESDRGYRRSYVDDGYGDTAAGSTSYGQFGETTQRNYGTGYSAGSAQPGSGFSSGGFGTGSTQPGSGLSSGGYGTGSTQPGSGYGSSSAGGTTGTNTGLGASSGLGSTTTSRDLASDVPSGSRGFGSSPGGMSGSGTTRPDSFGSDASTRGNDLGTGSLSDDETRTTGFGSDSLSARSDSGTDRDSLDTDTDRKSPDFL